jgi:hypothetical protein
MKLIVLAPSPTPQLSVQFLLRKILDLFKNEYQMDIKRAFLESDECALLFLQVPHLMK